MEIRPIFNRALELFRRRAVKVTPPPVSPEMRETVPELKRSRKGKGRGGSSHVRGRSPVYACRVNGCLPWTF